MTTVENIFTSRFYETIIENAESNVLILDCDFSIVCYNPGFYWIFLEALDIQLKKGANLFDLVHPVLPSVSDRWRTRCLAALKGLSISDEEEFESHGNNFAWKVYYKSVKVGEDQYISIYTRNISAAKNFQQKLFQTEANLRAILNSFEACILLLDERLELLDFNDHAFVHFINAYNVTLVPAKNFIEQLPESMQDLRQRWKDRINFTFLKKEKTFYLDQLIIHDAEATSETQIIPILVGDTVSAFTISMEAVSKINKLRIS